jgi:hypothetical protein
VSVEGLSTDPRSCKLSVGEIPGVDFVKKIAA